MVSLKQYLADVDARDIRVGEHNRYGGVNPVHGKGSYHYQEDASGDSRAADLNYGAPGTSAAERRELKWAARLADAAGLNVIYAHHRTHPNPRTNANHQGHLHVDNGPYSAYKRPGENDALYQEILAERPLPATKKRKPKKLTVIRRGSSGYAVRLFQERYNEWKGRKTLKVDGKFGPAVEKAVKDLQGSRGLVLDGVVGPLTWIELAEGARPGAPEYAVKIAQRIAGFEGAAVDGKHGPKTDLRMREVQKWLGVTEDANWGPDTTAAMKEKI